MGTGLVELTAITAKFFDDLARVLPDVLDDPGEDRALVDALQTCEHACRAVAVAQAAITHRVADRVWYLRDGHTRPAGWVAAALNQSGAATSRLVRLSDFLADHPDIAELVATNQLGVDQVAQLARVSRIWRVRKAFVEMLDTLLKSAMTDPYDVFLAFLNQWVELNDQDGAHHPAGEPHRQRKATLVSVGDSYLLNGEFGGLQGGELQEVFDAYCNNEFLADRDAAQAAWEQAGNPGDAPTTWLPRSPQQRAADALHAIFLAAASARADRDDPEASIDLTVLVDQRTFERALDRVTRLSADPTLEQHIAALIDPLRLRHADDDFASSDADDPCSYATAKIRDLGVCRLADGTLVDPQQAVIYGLLHGTVRRAVYDARGIVIDLGRRVRCFKAGSREAGLVQAALDNHQRCSWPGCRRRHTQLDHRHEWQHGGATEPGNVDPKCGHHNLLKSTGYRVRRDDDGHWHHYRPDGTELTAV